MPANNTVITPEQNARLPWLALLAAVYSVAVICWGTALIARNVGDPALNKEEVHYSFRDVACLEKRVQADPSVSFIGGQLLSAASYYLMPDNLRHGQYTKIAMAAAIPVMLMVLLRLTISGISAIACMTAALGFVFSPVASWWAINATVNGLDVVFGFVPLIMTLAFDRFSRARQRLLLFALPLISAFAIHVYAPAIAPIATSFVVLAFRLWQSERRLRGLLLWGITVAATSVLALWPFVAITTRPLHLFSGGAYSEFSQMQTGSLPNVQQLREGLAVYLTDLFQQAPFYSYLIFDDIPYPAFPLTRGYLFFVVTAGIGCATMFRFPRSRWIFAVAAMNVLLIALAVHHGPGVRRALPLVACICYFAGAGCELLLRASKNYIAARSFLCALILTTVSYPLILKGDLPEFNESSTPAPSVDTESNSSTAEPVPQLNSLRVAIVILDGVGASSTTPFSPRLTTTPFLNSLYQRGLAAESAFTPSTALDKTLAATLCGRYPFLRDRQIEAAVLKTDCLSQILRAHDYKTGVIAPKPYFASQELLHVLQLTAHLPQEELKGEEGYRFVLQQLERRLETARESSLDLSVIISPGANPDFSKPVPDTIIPSGSRAHSDFHGEYRRYLDAVQREDLFLQHVFATYERYGLLDDTVFVVTGSYGNGFGEHPGGLGHGRVLWNEGIHVPLVLISPKFSPKRLKTPASLIDIAPTVLTALGIDTPTAYHGSSLKSLQEERPLVVGCAAPLPCLAYIANGYKYIHQYGNWDDELYSLLEDPYELRNLISERQDIAQKLRSAALDEADRVGSIYRQAISDRQRPFLTPLPADDNTRVVTLPHGFMLYHFETSPSVATPGAPLSISMTLATPRKREPGWEFVVELRNGKDSRELLWFEPLSETFSSDEWPTNQGINVHSVINIPPDWSGTAEVWLSPRHFRYAQAGENAPEHQWFQLASIDVLTALDYGLLFMGLLVFFLLLFRRVPNTRGVSVGVLCVNSFAMAGTFLLTYAHVSLRLNMWLILNFAIPPNSNFELEVERILREMAREQVYLDQTAYSVDYLPMFNLLCKGRGLDCQPAVTADFNVFNLKSCVENVKFIELDTAPECDEVCSWREVESATRRKPTYRSKG